MKFLVPEYFSHKIDWREFLYGYIASHAKSNYSFTPPNMKYLYRGIYLPSLSSDLLRIIVAIDTSGSVDETLLSTFLGEVSSMMQQYPNYEIDLITADAYGNKIINNRVEYGTDSHGVGIYLVGKSDRTFNQYDWTVSENTVTGRSSGTSTLDVLITLRAINGVCNGNVTLNGDMGISADSTSDSVISNNRIGPTNGTTNYGIEINSSHNVISGNYIEGTTYGVIGTGDLGMDGNSITGNVFNECTLMAIFFTPTLGSTANFLIITGNTINFATAVTARTGIYLAKDCKYALISSNQFSGPGIGVPGTNAIFLVTIVDFSDITVTGNKFSNWLRPLVCYSAAADAYTDIAFTYNDCRTGMASDALFVSASGSATIGTRCYSVGNITSSGITREYYDYLTNRIMYHGLAGPTPEGGLVAGPGSICTSISGGTGATLFIKETGTGNTGWVAK